LSRHDKKSHNSHVPHPPGERNAVINISHNQSYCLTYLRWPACPHISAGLQSCAAVMPSMLLAVDGELNVADVFSHFSDGHTMQKSEPKCTMTSSFQHVAIAMHVLIKDQKP
jgi:hypothetical protein